MKRSNIIIMLAVVLILASVGIAAAQQAGQDAQAAQPGTGMTGSVIEVADQSVLQNTVFVNYVMSDGPGWVVIHKANADGTPGEVLGYTHVADGEHENVEIRFDAEPEGELIAMLHTDAEPVGTYDFPGADVPVRQADGIAMMAFEVYPQDQLGAEESGQQGQDGSSQDAAQQEGQEQPQKQ